MKTFEWKFKAGVTDCKFRFMIYVRGKEDNISDGEDDDTPEATSKQHELRVV